MLIVGSCLGLFARFRGLDRAPLAVDEYYFVRSVGFLLDSGVPRIPAGGYYIRGLVPQYLIAASVSLLGLNSVALRLPGVLLSLLVVALAFLYCRRFMDRPPALAVALSLLVSSWHVEFALFVRMYMAFQCATLLFLLSLDDVWHGNGWRRRYLPHVLAVVVTLTHSLGVLLAPMVLLPLIDWRDRERFPTLAHRLRFLGAGLLGICLSYVASTDPARNWNVAKPLPLDYQQDHVGGSAYWEPEFLLWSVTGDLHTDLMIFGGAMLALAAAVALWRRRSARELTEAEVIAALLLVSVAGHMFLVSAGLLALLVFRNRILDAGSPVGRARVLLGVSAAVACGWVVWAWFTSPLLGPQGGGLVGVAHGIRRLFFDWPQLFHAVFVPWSQNLPRLGLLAVLALAYQFATRVRLPLREMLRQPAAFILYIVACLSLLRSTYIEIRYGFFVYPILLCVIAQTAYDLGLAAARRWRWAAAGRAAHAAALIYLAAFAVGGDFHPRHLLHIADTDVVLRRPPYDRFRLLWYPREDYESPARFLNGIPADAASRIVVVDEPPVSYYLARDHAIYYDRSERRFTNVARHRGTTDLWSSRPLLSTPDEVRRYTESVTTVWLVQSTDSEDLPFDPATVWGPRMRETTRAHLGADGRIEVRKVVLD